MGEDGLRLDSKVALVTGGSRGIGRATALELARAGARVAVNYVVDERGALDVVGQIERDGGEAMAVQGDVVRPAAAEELVRACLMRWGRLDILVCSAGIWEGAPVEEMTEELWDNVLDTNLKGTWTVCRAAVRAMKGQGSGTIVIISSTAGQRGEAFYSNYAASKGGQIALTKALASELAPHGVRVNSVAPGWVETEMTAKALANESERLSIEKSIPLGRVASAQDVARPVVFLASDWARHITGEILNVNGGSVLCG